MVTIATRISTLGHGLPLLSGLANAGVWVHLHRVLYEQARRDAGRAAWSFGGRCGWPIGQDHQA